MADFLLGLGYAGLGAMCTVHADLIHVSESSP